MHSYRSWVIAGVMAITLFFSFSPYLALAQSSTTEADQSIKDLLCAPEDNSQGNDLYNCVNKLYKFAIAIGGIGAVAMIVVAGYLYMTGNSEQINTAKSLISTSVVGIVVFLASYVFLRMINPSIVAFRPIQPPLNQNVDALPDPEAVGKILTANLLHEAGGDGKEPVKPGSGSYKACGREFKDPGAEKSNIVSVTVKIWNQNKATLTKTLEVNKCIQDRIVKAFDAYYKDPEKYPIVELGGYNVRNVANSTSLSTHSFGLSIDVNASTNCHATNDGKCISKGKYEPGKDPLSMTANNSFVRAMKAQGFGWGGEWNSSKDYMHFSCTENEHGACP